MPDFLKAGVVLPRAKQDQFWVLHYGFALLVFSFAIVACGEIAATLKDIGRPGGTVSGSED
jgi:hypothetical protein